MFFLCLQFRKEITRPKKTKIIFTRTETTCLYHTQLKIWLNARNWSTEDNNWNETDTCRNRYLALNIDEPFEITSHNWWLQDERTVRFYMEIEKSTEYMACNQYACAVRFSMKMGKLCERKENCESAGQRNIILICVMDGWLGRDRMYFHWDCVVCILRNVSQYIIMIVLTHPMLAIVFSRNT